MPRAAGASTAMRCGTGESGSKHPTTFPSSPLLNSKQSSLLAKMQRHYLATRGHYLLTCCATAAGTAALNNLSFSSSPSPRSTAKNTRLALCESLFRPLPSLPLNPLFLSHPCNLPLLLSPPPFLGGAGAFINLICRPHRGCKCMLIRCASSASREDEWMDEEKEEEYVSIREEGRGRDEAAAKMAYAS